jgi:hypothetical protein
MDLWDSSLDLFSSTSGLLKLLERGDATVEACLLEDTFLEEVQGRNAALLALLTSPAGLDALLYYLTMPQHPRSADKAFRFPHMVCQALNCKVDELLDAVVAGDDSLLALFEPAAPGLCARRLRSRRVDTVDEVARGAGDPYLVAEGCAATAPGGLRPYLLGYWAKVVTTLCRARPAQLMRFLDATPGVARGLVGLCGAPSAAALLGALLACPWAPPAALCEPGCALSVADAPGDGLPATLLRVLEGALEGAERGGEGAFDGRAAEGAAAVLCAAVAGARAATPHPKFGGAPAPAQRPFSAPSGGTFAPPEDAAAALAGADPVSLPAALEASSLQLGATFFAPAPRAGDRVQLRVLKELRDGSCAGALAGLAARAAALVGAAVPRRAAEAQRAGDVPPTPRASAPAAAVFTLLAALLESCAEAYRHLSTEGYGFFCSGEGAGEEHAAATAPWPAAGAPRGGSPLPPPPALLTALCSGGDHSVVAALCGALSAMCGPSPTGALPPPSAPGAPRLGLPGVPLARAIAALTRCGWPAPAAAAAAAGAFPALLRALPAFPWHSILHRIVAAAAVDALAFAAPHVVSPLFLEARLLDRVVSGLRACGTPPSHGFSGHLHAVANAVLGAAERGTLPPQVAAHVAAHGPFWALVDGELADANVAAGLLLGGKLPPDSKSTGQVGVNADAMPAPAKKGGVGGGAGGGGVAAMRVAVAAEGGAGGDAWEARNLSPRAVDGRDGDGEHQARVVSKNGWGEKEEGGEESDAERALMGGSGGARANDGERGNGGTARATEGEEEDEQGEEDDGWDDGGALPAAESGGGSGEFVALAEDAAWDALRGEAGDGGAPLEDAFGSFADAAPPAATQPEGAPTNDSDPFSF